MTGGTLLAQAVGDATSGSGGTAIVVSGSAVMVAALGLLVQLGRMWADGRIVSKASADEERRLIAVIEENTRALEQMAETVDRVDANAERREASYERLVEVYLPKRGD